MASFYNVARAAGGNGSNVGSNTSFVALHVDGANEGEGADAEILQQTGVRGTGDLSGACSSFYERPRRLRNRDLRDKIRSKNNATEILDLVWDRGWLWDAISVSTALHTVAWKCRDGSACPDFLHDERWLYLRQLVVEKLAMGEARNLANNAWSLATIMCCDWPLLGAIAARVGPNLPDFKTQELSNTAWAFATLRLEDKPLFESIGTEVMEKASLGVNQDLTNTMWAFATVAVVPERMFELLPDIAVQRVNEFKPQELSNSLWALATASLKHDLLVYHVSRRAIEILPEFLTQNISNFFWAYAKMGYKDDLVIETVEFESAKRFDLFSAQDLSTFVWALATTSHRDDRFLARAVEAIRVRAKASTLQPQHASNTLWAFAVVSFHDQACFQDLTAGAMRQWAEFKPQELSNIIWACASATHSDPIFADSACSQAAKMMREFDAQGVGNTLWAASVLKTSIRDVYFEAWGRLDDPVLYAACSEKTYSMLVSGLFRSGEAALAWKLFARTVADQVNPGIAAFGTWLHQCRHIDPDPQREIALMLYFAKLRPCRHMTIIVLNAVVMRLAEFGDHDSAHWLLDRMRGDCAGDAATAILDERLPTRRFNGLLHNAGSGITALNPDSHLRWHVPPSRPRNNPRCDYDKECHVLRYVLSTAKAGDPDTVVRQIEQFSFEGHGWLKIAGGEKGVVLDDLIRTVPSSTPNLVMEFGCYVGYSAIRFARLLKPSGGRVVSVEVDPIHACIARNMLEFAGVADAVEIVVGHSEDAIPHLAQVTRGAKADVVFMDQRGTRFHKDLAALEDHGLIADSCLVTADNVLKPGAPHFLWHLQSTEEYDLTVVSLREFAAERIEDWMVVAQRVIRQQSQNRNTEFPECLSELAFRTDRARQRSCAGDRPGEVGEDDWAHHSQEVRKLYAAAGICPRIVEIKRREDDSPYVNW